MGHRLETRRHHESSSAANEIKSSLANQSSKLRGKYKVESTEDKPYISRHHGVNKTVNQNVSQLSSSGNHQNQWLGSKENKDDELVKYMSNLPGYLQHPEKGKNIQGKALNFGVLDWERLEKWKYNERMPVSCHRKTLSGSSSFVAIRPATAYGMSSQRKQMPLPRVPSCEQKLAEPVQQSKSEFVQTQDLQTTQSPTKHGKQKQRFRKEIPPRRRNSELNIGKYMDRDHVQKMRPDEDLPRVPIKNVSVSCSHTNRGQDCKSEIKFDNEGNLSSQNYAAEPKNIVLLVPKHRSKTSMEASRFSESKTSFDEQPAEPMRTEFSDCSSQESFSRELLAVPHSCPLPASSSMNTESPVKQRQLSNVRDITDLCLSLCQNERITSRSSFDAKCPKPHKSDVELRVPADTLQRADLDTAEQAVVKGRHPSPNKRFSFSLSRMSRSFSFKETSAVPPLNSTNSIPKSGPAGASSSTDLSIREKPNAGSRGRSSPLRRLLDPLLKPKAVHSAETFLLSNGNANGNTLPTNHSKHIHVKKHQPSTLQALLQLSLKDGVPFFKLVVDDDGGILAAAVKKLPTSGKGGSSLVYAFYAVHEIKRRSGGWMSHGPKERSTGFGYKVIGQMEISCSEVQNSSVHDHKSISVQRESVLYSIDCGQVEKQVPDSCQRRELASIVVMNSSQYKQEGMQQSPGETCEAYSDAVVILPGGTHSLPNDGTPSSLLERWRSGGLCDCGGWDVGCKLKILEQDKNCRSQDFLNLLIQGGDRRSKPIFSMAPLKNGLYTVEFDSSIPLLEAFSICVSALTSNKLADIFEVGQKASSYATWGTKASTTVQGQVPQRYVSSPPPSPVGRI